MSDSNKPSYASVPSSIERTVYRLALLSSTPVTFNGKPCLPSPPTRVTLGGSVFRKFVCDPSCDACCMILPGPITLDYIPPEVESMPTPPPEAFEETEVVVNETTFPVLSTIKPIYGCPFLTVQKSCGGKGCELWPHHPLECWAAYKIQIQKYRGGSIILKRPPSRAWRWSVPPKCSYPEVPLDEMTQELKTDLDILKRYFKWARYFGIPTLLPQLIDLFEAMIHQPNPETFRRPFSIDFDTPNLVKYTY